MATFCIDKALFFFLLILVSCLVIYTIFKEYRNYQETKKLGLPADADLWERTREYIIKHNLKSYFINKLTCRHDEEGFEK